jgi:hypothetical protein
VGRHSAPEDDAAELLESLAPTESPVAVAAPARGRHARTDDDDQTSAVEDTAKIARVDPFVDTAETALPPTDGGQSVTEPLAEPAGEPQRKRPRERSTAADLALFREHSDVRARVIAALLVPFAVYTAALAAMGKLDRTYLLWIWIPLVTAGILVGLFLDLGHRKYRR